MDSREAALTHWSTQQLQALDFVNTHRVELQSVSGDASFRRYFRASLGDKTVIAMDAPPEYENSLPFTALAKHWHASGVAVPMVLAKDLDLGFMLLEDFGDELLLPHLSADSADRLYGQALEALVTIQRLDHAPDYMLPRYTAAKLDAEMQLCPEWFLARLLGVELSESERALLNQVFSLLVDRALAQPEVCVHRDYHARNLLIKPDQSLGIIDFQDACIGPLSYDVVSLVRDCYISWSNIKERDLIDRYLQLAERGGVPLPADSEAFYKDFEWMGLQRHIKCLGIFSRLCLRDEKARYLRDIPRTFSYVVDVSSRYTEFSEFHGWLNERVVPAIGSEPRVPSLKNVGVCA